MATSRTAHATGPGGEHPDLETLAAYLDGRLSSGERTAVMQHLAACQDCFGLFADTARAMRELEPAGGRVARFPFERRWVGRALPLAAAAALVAVAGLVAYRWLWQPAPRIEVAEVVAPLAGKPGITDHIWSNPMRSGDRPRSAPAARAFQLGARLVDFQLAVETGGKSGVAAASEAARRIMVVLDDAGSYDHEEARFREAFLTLSEARVSIDRYRGLAAELTPAFEEGFSPGYLDFGKWTAAGRLSAKVGDESFFERRAHRRFLRLLLEDPQSLDDTMPDELPTEVRERLEEIARAWDAGRFATGDYKRIAAALTRVLDIYERMTDDLLDTDMLGT